MNAVRVMIVDDHAAFSRAATSFLQDHCEEGVIVVGTATDIDKAVTLAKDSQPQLVLLDLGMTNHVWRDTIAHLRALLPEVHIIVLALFDAEPYRRIARQVGADDCIAKASLTTDLLPAIRRATLTRRNKHENYEL